MAGEIRDTPDIVENLQAFTNEQDLQRLLEQSGVNTNEWGLDDAKTVGHLLREVQVGDATLYITTEGAVARRLSSVWIDVFYSAPSNEIYQLREKEQIFKDARVRRRELSSSLGEKMKMSEEPGAAATRALQEELGIVQPKTLFLTETKEISRDSKSYPGLRSDFTIHHAVAVIGDEDFIPEGYVEEQADKATYFEWWQIR